MNKHSEKFLRKRKALLVLPLLALPFITLAFWAMGGGKGPAAQQVAQKQGINTSLPDAQLSGSSLDKMSLYSKAAGDSAAKAQGNGPFAGRDSMTNKGADSALASQSLLPSTATGNVGLKANTDPGEARVRSKLAELEQALNQPPQPNSPVSNNAPAGADNQDMEAELNRLQQAMGGGQGSGQDPEMQQLSGMLEKILDIQHPDRVRQQLREQSIKNKGRVYPVSSPVEQTGAALLKRDREDTPFHSPYGVSGSSGNSFYDLEETIHSDPAAPVIPAVVQETQTVVSGSTIKMRLTGDVFINGVLIPENNFVFGTCSVDGERLKIDITGIRFNNNLFPVSLSVYDLDALEGIRIPGAISRDAGKEGADRAIQGVQLMSLDPSVGAQAAGAGLEAAKGLFSKKVKLVRVTVKAGYPVLLLDAKAKQDTN